MGFIWFQWKFHEGFMEVHPSLIKFIGRFVEYYETAGRDLGVACGCTMLPKCQGGVAELSLRFTDLPLTCG